MPPVVDKFATERRKLSSTKNVPDKRSQFHLCRRYGKVGELRADHPFLGYPHEVAEWLVGPADEPGGSKPNVIDAPMHLHSLQDRLLHVGKPVCLDLLGNVAEDEEID